MPEPCREADASVAASRGSGFVGMRMGRLSRRLRPARAGVMAAVALVAASVLGGCFLDPAIRVEDNRREAFDYYTRGLDFEARGEYVRALDHYMRAIETDPRPAFYYHAGLCHDRLGNEARAIELLDEAIALAPGYHLAKAERDLIRERRALASRLDPELSDQTPPAEEVPVPVVSDTATPLAVKPPARPSRPEVPSTDGLPPPEQVRRAVFPELFPDETVEMPMEEREARGTTFPFPPTEEDQARLAMEADRLEQGVFYLERRLKQHPEDWALRLRLAAVLARAGRLSRAEAELREAARLAPQSDEVWYEWGGFHVRQQNWIEAEACYRQCLRIAPDSVRARNNLGAVLLKLRQWELAREQFLHVTELAPDFASPYLNLAIIEVQNRGDLDQGVTYVDEYIRHEGARAAEARRWRQNLLLRKTGEPSTPPPSGSSPLADTP